MWPPVSPTAFLRPGLQPWDVAAGSLLVTEAGGLVGNFTGEADFLEQKECLAGNPRIYGQAGVHPGQVQQVCRARSRFRPMIGAPKSPPKARF
jgi:hypothetical protein